MLTAQGFSQKRFSELTGISYESIGAYLRGYRVPSMPKFLLMVEYLPGVDVTWLLTGQTQAELE